MWPPQPDSFKRMLGGGLCALGGPSNRQDRQPYWDWQVDQTGDQHDLPPYRGEGMAKVGKRTTGCPFCRWGKVNGTYRICMSDKRDG
jgi:hypothetical protein